MPPRPFVQLDEVVRECFNHTVSLFWGEPGGNCPLKSATGFLIDLGRPVLLTARHVIDDFLKAQSINDSLLLKVGKGNIDRIHQRIISSDENIDLIALNLSGIDVTSFQLSHIQFFKPKRWPPKCIPHSAQVFFIGFVVNGYREILHAERAILFNSFTVNTQVDSVSTTGFSCAIKMENVKCYAPPDAKWPTKYGGLSGSPVFVIWDDIGLELIGIVYQANNAFDIICAHHLTLGLL